MKSELTIIISSRTDAEEKKKLLENIELTIGVSANIIFIKNEGVSLTQVYNEAIKQSKNDIVIIMHDDVEFLKNDWGTSIMQIFENNPEFGIIGVAGSAEFNERAAWWTYENIYGQVLHRDNEKSWLSTFSPLLKCDVKEVCVVDGLFMAIHKKRISQTFSDDIEGFNFYDIDFCIKNFLDKKCKIGVTTNVRMAHNSIGKLSENWYKNRELINKKYKKYYPLKV